MTVARPRVAAVGGTRTVPEPDGVARDYLLLALRLDQYLPGLVDGYYGPADLKATVDLESRRTPARLREDAAALRERIRAEVEPAERRAWLEAQAGALEMHAVVAGGADLPYVEQVRAAFGFGPARCDDAAFDAAAGEIDRLLPGPAPLAARLAAWDARLEIPTERLPAVVDWLVAAFRARAAATFGVPPGEDLRVTLVRGQPWSGYNWYDGGLRSRVDLNTDLPIRAPQLTHTIAHETFPGHHLEHAWKEADLVERNGRLEASVLLINTPECLVSEGLADLGYRFALPPAERPAFFAELFRRAGLQLGPEAALREVAVVAAALMEPRAILRAAAVNAALMRHADGAPQKVVLDYLVETGRFAPDVAAKRLEFIEHPLWRTYVFVYSEGEALLRAWVDSVPEVDRAGRFARLLHEQLAPGAIVDEVGA
ncbi:MAG TPA: DUF885 domain-containing protein [Clostridia bacterium]|nr:DUF885 domain-containing protein [Clostridia bacterium]